MSSLPAALAALFLILAAGFGSNRLADTQLARNRMAGTVSALLVLRHRRRLPHAMARQLFRARPCLASFRHADLSRARNFRCRADASPLHDFEVGFAQI